MGRVIRKEMSADDLDQGLPCLAGFMCHCQKRDPHFSARYAEVDHLQKKLEMFCSRICPHCVSAELRAVFFFIEA